MQDIICCGPEDNNAHKKGSSGSKPDIDEKEVTFEAERRDGMLFKM